MSIRGVAVARAMVPRPQESVSWFSAAARQLPYLTVGELHAIAAIRAALGAGAGAASPRRDDADMPLRLMPGPPVVEELTGTGPARTVNRPAHDHFFQNDDLAPMPAGLRTALAVDAGDITPLTAAIDGCGLPRCHGPAGGATGTGATGTGATGTGRDAIRTVPLAGGRPGDPASWGAVRLCAVGAGCGTAGGGAVGAGELITELPAWLPRGDRQRSFRAAMCVLRTLGRMARDERPGLSHAIGQHVDEVTSGLPGAGSRDEPDAAPPLVPLVPLDGRAMLPVGVVVQTDRPHNYFCHAMAAQSWLLVTRQATAHRPAGAHRPSVLTDDRGMPLNYLRYAAHPDDRVDLATAITRDAAWYWEVVVRKLGGPEAPSTGGLLLATGISPSGGYADGDYEEYGSHGGCLRYGSELLTLFRAFAAIAVADDPSAEVSTIYLPAG